MPEVGRVTGVGAPLLRRHYGARVRMTVILYTVDAEQNLWAYTLADAQMTPLARSVQPRRGVEGVPFLQLCEQIETLTGVRIEQAAGRRGLLRSDGQLDVAVRTVDSPGELQFRRDKL